MNSFLLLESGDRVLLESGDALVLEDHVRWLMQWPLPDLVEHVGWLLGKLGSDAIGDLTDGNVPPEAFTFAVVLAARAVARKMRDPRRETEAERRRRMALAQLEADPRFQRTRPEDRVPKGQVEITLGRWIPGSRGKRRAPGSD
jgi:hypothetical protein